MVLDPWLSVFESCRTPVSGDFIGCVHVRSDFFSQLLMSVYVKASVSLCCVSGRGRHLPPNFVL